MASNYTLADILTQSNLNLLADALRKVNLGELFKSQVESISQASSTSVVLSKVAFGAQAISVRVTAGAGAGSYLVGKELPSGELVDAADGVSVGVCSLGADGKTLTFKTAVTTAEICYSAASEIPLSDVFADFI